MVFGCRKEQLERDFQKSTQTGVSRMLFFIRFYAAGGKFGRHEASRWFRLLRTLSTQQGTRKLLNAVVAWGIRS